MPEHGEPGAQYEASSAAVRRRPPTQGAESGNGVLHRCDFFVARTTNWLYDHVRCIPRYDSFVLCDELAHRREFPLLDARSTNATKLSRRAWRRIVGERPFPTEARWIRRHRPRLLHSHFGYVAAGDAPLRAYLDVPWLVSFYGADVYELGRSPEWRARYARLFADARLVLALGPQMAAGLHALGCPRDKILVHPLGVDVESIPHRQRVLKRGDVLRILFAGTLREKKGVEYAIRGAALAREAGVRLHVTLVGDATGKPGDAETKEAVFEEIERLNLTDVVTHHPHVEFDRLMTMGLASHVFVAPSVTSATGDAEGTPFVLQQMMASGMPAIATVHSDIPYLFGPHASRLVPERDAEAIARELVRYAEDPESLIRDGAELRQQIQNSFDVRHCAARLSDIYDSLLT